MLKYILYNFVPRWIMTRREAREEAFILIFEKQFNEASTEEILELAQEVRDLQPDDYIKTVFFGVYDNLETLDNIRLENRQNCKGCFMHFKTCNL